MGGRMADNLHAAGFGLSVFDLRQDVVDDFAARGARAAHSPRDVAEGVDVLFVMVMTNDQTNSVLFGENGAVEGLPKGGIVACTNTIGVSEIKAIAEKLASHGLRTLDAPVSGGAPGALAGTLTFMTGASTDVAEETRSMLEAMGNQIFHCGEVGAGQTLKMMNQLLCSVEMVSIAEALTLGAKAGIDGQTLFEVTRAGSGNSEMFGRKVPKIIAGDFTSFGDLDIHVKDLEIVTKAAKELGVPTFLTTVAEEVFRTAQLMGKGKLDACAVIQVVEEISGAQARSAEAFSTNSAIIG
jgi:3-hydroxyisobutyrate dehydrogenase-like beta-hydroxyacid dehydrogenase